MAQNTVSSNVLETEELYSLIEDTFDTCSSNREELYWLVTILRGLMNCPNHRNDLHPDNYNLNLWQYQINNILEVYRNKWHHSTIKNKEILRKDGREITRFL